MDKSELIEILNQRDMALAAAKAELAAEREKRVGLEKERNNYLSFGQGGASFTDSQWLDKLASAEQRAEQAEAQCVAYKKALDIAMSTNQSHETYCKVEAALEGK